MEAATLSGRIEIATGSIDRAVDAINRLESALNKASGNIEKALQRVGSSQNAMAASTENASSRAERGAAAQLRQEQAILKLDQAYARIEKQIRSSNASSQTATQQINQLINSYSRAESQIRSSEGSQRRISAAFLDFNRNALNTSATLAVVERNHKRHADSVRESERAENQNNKALKQAEQSHISKINAITQAETKTSNLVSNIERSNLSQEEQQRAIRQVTSAYREYNHAVTESGAKSVRAAEAKSRLTKTTNVINQQLRQTSQSFVGTSGQVDIFNQNMQNMTKSVQLALGPLSGVAARITALTALFNRNAATIAALIAGFTGFVIALQRTIQYGRQLELEMTQVEAVIRSMGDNTDVTSEQVLALSRIIGRETLASAGDVRQAATILATFNNVAADSFYDVITAAQGLSDTFGGSLQDNTRQLGRLLEDPIRNLDALGRRGIQFNQRQRALIRSFQESGDLASAQAIIYERLAAQQEAARSAADTLAGAYDTLGEAVKEFFEAANEAGRITERLQSIIEGLTNSIINLADHTIASEAAGAAFAATMEGIGASLEFVSENLDVAVALFGVLLSRAILTVIFATARLTTTIFKWTVNVQAATAAKTAYNASLSTGATRLAALRVAMMALPWMAFAQGIATIGAAILVFNNRMDQTPSKITEIEQAVRDQVTRIKGLGEATRDEAELMISQYREKTAVHQQRIRELEEERKAEEERLRSIRARGPGEEARATIDRSAARQEIARVTGEISELDQLVGTINDGIDQLTQALDGLGGGVQRLDIDDLNRRFEELQDRFVDGAKEAREYEEAMNRVGGVVRQFDIALEQNADALSFNKDQLDELQRAVAISPWKDLVDDIQEAVRSNQEFTFTLRGVGNDMDRLQEHLAFQKITREINEMNDEALRATARILGLADEEATVDNVTAAYRRQMEVMRAREQLPGVLGGLDEDPSQFATVNLDAIERDFQRRREIIEMAYQDELELAQEHLDRLDQLEQRATNRRVMAVSQTYLDGTNQMFDSLADAARMASGEQSNTYKRLAIFQATVSTLAGMTRALADNPYPLSLGIASAIAAQGFANVAQIRSQNFATGGLVQGPGGSMADRIPAMLSNGEFVLRASAVRSLGLENVERLNNGQLPALSRGGMVGSARSRNTGMGGIEIYDQRMQGADIETEQVTDPNGQTKTRLYIRDAVRETMSRGGLDRDMEIHYGQRRRGNFR